MEAVWGAVLAFLFVLATLSGYNVAGPMTSAQQEQLEKKLKEQKDEFDKQQKDQKDELEKKQKEKSEKTDKSEKKKSDQNDRSSPAKASKKKSSFCIEDCPDEWQIRQ